MTARRTSANRTRTVLACGAGLLLLGTGVAVAQGGGWRPSGSHGFTPVADSFSGHGTVTGNVLRNGHGATAVVRNTAPPHGSVVVNADGTFRHQPASGFTGTDSFTYTASDAVHLYRDTSADGSPLPPLGTVAGPNGSTTSISTEGFGSSLAPVPGRAGWFCGLTERPCRPPASRTTERSSRSTRPGCPRCSRPSR